MKRKIIKFFLRVLKYTPESEIDRFLRRMKEEFPEEYVTVEITKVRYSHLDEDEKTEYTSYTQGGRHKKSYSIEGSIAKQKGLEI